MEERRRPQLQQGRDEVLSSLRFEQISSLTFFLLIHDKCILHCYTLSRGPMRIRPERSGRDGPGPSLRGAASATRGRSSFNDRDGGRPMVMTDQVSLSLD